MDRLFSFFLALLLRFLLFKPPLCSRSYRFRCLVYSVFRA